MTESVEKLCQSVKNNDLSDILMNQIDYPVVICHSPDDELIYFDNVPNTAEYEHLSEYNFDMREHISRHLHMH